MVLAANTSMPISHSSTTTLMKTCGRRFLQTTTTFFNSSSTAQSVFKCLPCKTATLFVNLKPLAEDCATLYTNTGQRSSQVLASLRSLPNPAAVFFLLRMYIFCCTLPFCVALWTFVVVSFYCCIIGGSSVVLLSLCMIGDGDCDCDWCDIYEDFFGAPSTGGIYVTTTTTLVSVVTFCLGSVISLPTDHNKSSWKERRVICQM